MRLIGRLLIAGVAVGVVAVPSAGTAQAADGTPPPRTAERTPAEEAAAERERAGQPKVMAHYKGALIDLSRGWQGAQVCTEIPTGEVYCHDSPAEADRELAKLPEHANYVLAQERLLASATSPGGHARADKASADFGSASLADCALGYACLFQHPHYGGRRLQWAAPGSKNLGDWDFRDRASSASINRSMGAHGVDWRTLQLDPTIWFGALYAYGDFRDYGYVYGGNWDNKLDEFVLS